MQLQSDPADPGETDWAAPTGAGKHAKAVAAHFTLMHPDVINRAIPTLLHEQHGSQQSDRALVFGCKLWVGLHIQNLHLSHEPLSRLQIQITAQAKTDYSPGQHQTGIQSAWCPGQCCLTAAKSSIRRVWVPKPLHQALSPCTGLYCCLNP